MIDSMRILRSALLAGLAALAAVPPAAADEPSTQRKAELKATADRRKAQRQGKAEARRRRSQEAAKAQALRAEASRRAALSDPLRALEARRQQLAAEIAAAENYQSGQARRQNDQARSSDSRRDRLADPVYLEVRRQEAFRLEREWQRQLTIQAQNVQQAQAQAPANSLDAYTFPTGTAPAQVRSGSLPVQPQQPPATPAPKPEPPKPQPAAPPRVQMHASQRGG